jgi:hypothetical protein
VFTGIKNTEFDYGDIYLAKIDPTDGDTLLFQIYNYDDYQYGHFVREFSDGNLLILATDYYNPNATFLMKTLSNGETVWQKNYGNIMGTTGLGITEDDTIFFSNGNPFCEPKGYTIYKIDSSGNEINSNAFDSDCATIIIPSKIGGFIGSGINLPEYFYNAYTFRADEAGEILWKYDTTWDIDTMYNNELYADIIEELPNGDLYVAGYYSARPTGKYIGFITKINKNRNPYWERQYTSQNLFDFDNRVHDIALTDDGGLIIAGAAFSEDLSEDQNFWLLKLDSMGCLIPGCDTLITLIMELPYDKAGILVYPNPVTTEAIVQITLNDVADTDNLVCELTNISGRVVKQIEVGSSHYALNGNKLTFPLRRENLQPGVYLLQIKTNSAVLGVTKILFD